ncbi:putative ankyrin repeat protein RF_0381 [Saccostrea echinata]|uniref:putative ankyrin repeat protein RF_0381 n=1 Tax=Saccostrea echinata TaxID=191078 RepID=UPI002A84099D|nr:putative ankyrin repeat protein RF_0381 [Saccostrea echinata]
MTSYCITDLVNISGICSSLQVQKHATRKKPCLGQYVPEKGVSEDDLDPTLLCSILQNLFSLTPAENQDISNLRERRNTIAHSRNAHMDNATYENEKLVIKDSIEFIANSCGKDVLMKVRREIENITKSPLSDSMGHNVLSSLHGVEETTEEIRRDLAVEIFHFSCKNGNFEIVDYICKAYPDTRIAVDGDGKNATHFAAEGGYVNVLQILLEKSIPPFECTIDGMTILHIACLKAHYEKCQYILSKFPRMLYFVSNDGLNPSHYATEGENAGILKALLQRGLQANQTTNAKMNLLHIACMHAHYDMCQYLVTEFLEMVHGVTEDGLNASHFAAQGGNVNILRMLIESGAKIKQTNNDEENILHLACASA